MTINISTYKDADICKFIGIFDPIDDISITSRQERNKNSLVVATYVTTFTEAEDYIDTPTDKHIENGIKAIIKMFQLNLTDTAYNRHKSEQFVAHFIKNFKKVHSVDITIESNQISLDEIFNQISVVPDLMRQRVMITRLDGLAPKNYQEIGLIFT